jgi:membrane-bound lytic murein transglycosylase B
MTQASRYICLPVAAALDLLDSQPEFTKAVWDYLDFLVTDERIRNGRAILARHRTTFDAVEKAYGVDRHFIAAIWGIESDCGPQAAVMGTINQSSIFNLTFSW